ncbi:uncharacterized protein PHACADRAFT_104618 [Phanerochaete carnosa HHB-10118-sp]|uniref:BTB domain-containing protein n=1 Tax=Phanerochaete carnosa (strain HHB-10118-sp) TaxID=650164 RepID=K5WJX0_PHACS|nr:uncharacterized protein PHACADRAFT_104618 [Phanerochaete carnosa HHB-10118-sp]EKM50557.1 hypothetical protein PHACADRAFT_104618 [Phanerochaete carnosa HHB-10118-sp]
MTIINLSASVVASPLTVCKRLVVGTPFNKPAADVVVHSSDGIDFYIWKSILAESSLFFKGMFMLSQTTKHVKDEYIDGHPVISVSETSKMLRSLLLFCYPACNPTLGIDKDICAVLEAARKYDMEHVAERVRALFLADVEGNPFRIYALANARGWKEEMKITAKATLSRPLLLELPAMCSLGMEDLPLGNFFKLHAYQQMCIDATYWLVQTKQTNMRLSMDWLPARAPETDWIWLRCRHRIALPEFTPIGIAPSGAAKTHVMLNGVTKEASLWWV